MTLSQIRLRSPLLDLLAPPEGPGPGVLRDWWLFHLAVPVTFGFLLGANRTGIADFLPWGYGISYWVVLAVISWQILHICTALMAWAFRGLQPPVLVSLTLGALVASFLLRPMIYSFAQLFAAVLVEGRSVRSPPEFALDFEFLLRHLQVWAGAIAVWVGSNLIFERLLGLPRYRPGATLAGGRPLPATPEGRLPPAAREGVIALKSEDHYVRVYSTAGETLVLMRISDAIREVAQVEGVRVHRSYWVAKRAVQRTEVQGRSLVAHLVNGLQVPISQTYKETARQAGLVP